VTGISSEHWERMHYEQFQQMLTNLYVEESLYNTDKIIEQIQTLEQFSLDNKRIFCLFSHIDFFLTYISENVENVMGYSPDYIYKGGLFLGFKKIYWKQLPMALKVHQWGDRFQEIVQYLPYKGGERMAFYCGVKIRDKQGELRTFFVKQKMLGFAKNNKPLLSFMEVEEVTTIFKGDFVWCRMSAVHEKQAYIRTFFSEGKKKEYADLLSGREMEILQLVAKKNSNTEISEILGISKNTVERHRKNMIARAGVVDMTGLIYICRLCQIL